MQSIQSIAPFQPAIFLAVDSHYDKRYQIDGPKFMNKYKL